MYDGSISNYNKIEEDASYHEIISFEDEKDIRKRYLDELAKNKDNSQKISVLNVALINYFIKKDRFDLAKDVLKKQTSFCTEELITLFASKIDVEILSKTDIDFINEVLKYLSHIKTNNNGHHVIHDLKEKIKKIKEKIKQKSKKKNDKYKNKETKLSTSYQKKENLTVSQNKAESPEEAISFLSKYISEQKQNIKTLNEEKQLVLSQVNTSQRKLDDLTKQLHTVIQEKEAKSFKLEDIEQKYNKLKKENDTYKIKTQKNEEELGNKIESLSNSIDILKESHKIEIQSLKINIRNKLKIRYDDFLDKKDELSNNQLKILIANIFADLEYLDIKFK